jgi:diguanylate cyclase (GGDEF)-like protein
MMRAPVFVFFLVVATMSDAQDSPRPIDVTNQSAPVFTTFGTKDGLSDEVWATIGFDRHGFVWAGSASSLARFDGYRWTSSPFHAGQGLVRDMEKDERGNLWTIFEQGGLARYDGSEWTYVGSRREFHERFSGVTDPSGKRTLWLPRDRSFLRLDGDTWSDAIVDDPPSSLGPVRLERTETLFGEPREWMLTRSGLWYRAVLAGAAPAPWRLFVGEGLDRISGIDLKRTVDRGVEELWVLEYSHPLRRITNAGIRTWRASTGELPSEAVYSAVATQSHEGDRLLWIASRAGLLRIRGDTVMAFDRRHGLPSDAVRGIKLQREENGEEFLWVATEGGIARAALEDSPWRTVSLLGARLNGIFGLLLEPDGRGGERLWIGSAQEGAALLERGKWRSFTRENGGLPDNGTTGLWRETGPDETPWRLISTDGAKLVRVRDDFSLQEIRVPWISPTDLFTGGLLSRRAAGMRELWFTARTGLYRWRNGQWKHFTAPTARNPWRVSRIVEQTDPSGRAWLWAASEQGIARFDGESWDLLPVEVGGVNGAVRGVTLIADGTRAVLWAGSMRSGVIRLDVTDPRHPVVLKGPDVPQPKDPTVYSVLADSRGRIYVCTNNGVQQLTPKAGGGYNERLFRRPDGLVHDECNTNSQFIDAHDRYWVGTLGGLSVYDPDLRPPSRSMRPRPLYFTDLRVDGAHHDPLVETTLDLPAGAREVRVDFTLLAGRRERESTYRSQLVGYDPQPTAWTTENSRGFTGLPPGPYHLIVEARDFAGAASPPRTLTFSVRPFWWQLRAARAGFAFGVILLLAAGVFAYSRNLRARQKQLVREVAARTADLDAANLRLTELSYLDPLTGIANRRRLIEATDAAIERAAAKNLPLGVIVVDVDHFKPYNDRFGHLAGDAALRAVSQALANATREQDLVARFGGEEFACLLQDASVDTVEAIAERMRMLVEALPPRALGNGSQTITISAGFVCRVPSSIERATDLLEQADAALYEAKRDGRNRVRRARPVASA